MTSIFCLLRKASFFAVVCAGLCIALPFSSCKAVGAVDEGKRAAPVEALVPSEGVLDPEFTPSTLEYTLVVSADTDQVDFSYVRGGNPVEITEGSPVTLASSGVEDVVVKVEDKEFLVTIIKLPSPNLSKIGFGTAASEITTPDKNISQSFASSVTSVEVEFTPVDSDAVISAAIDGGAAEVLTANDNKKTVSFGVEGPAVTHTVEVVVTNQKAYVPAGYEIKSTYTLTLGRESDGYIANGGIRTSVGDDEVHVFKTVGMQDLTFYYVSGSIQAKILVVAGGGGGGGSHSADWGGGGGAGGLVRDANFSLDTAKIWKAVVGGGGSGGAGGSGSSPLDPGTDGGVSSFYDSDESLTDWGVTVGKGILVRGGGRGGTHGVGPNDGGSGGGGYWGDGASGQSGQGNDGGNAGSGPGGGGGGAKSAGNVRTAGAGYGVSDAELVPFTSGITGLPSSFARGGGGKDGGGNNSGAGTANSGDGGRCSNGTNTAGSPGGSGIIIVRFSKQ